MSKLFSCDYITIHRNVARWDSREEKNKEKDDGFLLLWGIFNEYIKQNIIMAKWRKANFHSVNTCKLTTDQSYKNDQGERLIQNPDPKWRMRF